jgi:DNA-binding MarR family transcriptional regulator
MARGLSLVQKQILMVALRERFVLCRDLLRLWGVQPGAAIEKRKYGAAHSSISRCLSRLWLRNLIELWQDKINHYRTGVSLTDEGKIMAESIIIDEKESG